MTRAHKIGYAFSIIIIGTFLWYAPVKAGNHEIQMRKESSVGVGALGQIEPRSRVRRISHDAGPEGAHIERLSIIEGQEVKAGDAIATFSDYGLKETKLAAAKAHIPVLIAKLKIEEASYHFDKYERERAETLVKDRAVSKVRQQELERNYQQTQARIDALQAEIELANAEIAIAEKELKRSQIFAPANGTILKILSWPGERVSDRGVVEMADLAFMDVVAQVYERDMPSVAIGQKAEVRIPGFSTPIIGQVRELGFQVMKNDLNSTDPLADKDNRIVEVRITLPSDVVEKVKHLIFMQVDVRIFK